MVLRLVAVLLAAAAVGGLAQAIRPLELGGYSKARALEEVRAEFGDAITRLSCEPDERADGWACSVAYDADGEQGSEQFVVSDRPEPRTGDLH